MIGSSGSSGQFSLKLLMYKFETRKISSYICNAYSPSYSEMERTQKAKEILVKDEYHGYMSQI